MELRQLRHFLALAEEMHFGRGAARVCISQPALSASISRLEEDLNVRLFERDKKSVRLTFAGNLMLSYARDLIAQAERTRCFSQALAAGKVGRISVGFSCAVLTPELDKVFTTFRKVFPEIEIVMIENSSQRQFELLISGQLDAGLVNFPVPPAGLEYIELFTNRFVVCLPKGHHLAAHKILHLSQLRNEPFILLSRDRAPSVYDMMLGMCVTAGFQPKIAYESEHTFSTVSLVERGLGVALVLDVVIHANFKSVIFVPLDLQMPNWCGYFAWNAHRHVAGLQSLIDSIQNFAKISK